MTTPAEARAAAEAYVAEYRPGCRVALLLEDNTDFFAQLGLLHGTQWRVGESYTFVSKATGQIWTSVPMDVFDKIDAMTPVEW